jgi:hypothetical protein
MLRDPLSRRAVVVPNDAAHPKRRARRMKPQAAAVRDIAGKKAIACDRSADSSRVEIAGASGD